MPENAFSRRDFLQQSAPAALGLGLATQTLTASNAYGALGANERIGVGCIGVGGRGGYLESLFQMARGLDLRAICDVNARNLANIAKQAEAIDPENGHKIRKLDDYRKLLEDDSIDVVVVATNEHWHVLPAIHACQAGKDVYLEKPVGTSIGEGRALANIVKKHGRILQMGTQQRSWEHYHKAVEIIRSGVLGEISHVETWDFDNFYPGFGAPANQDPPDHVDWDFWLGPAPEVAYNPNRHKRHYWFFDYGGGWQVAWGHHHYDIVHWAMGVDQPVAGSGFGSKVAYRDSNTQWPDTFTGQVEYPPGPVAKQGFVMSYTARTANQNPRHYCGHGKAFYGTHGTLVLDRTGYQVNAEWRNGRKVIVEDKMTTAKSEHDVVRDHIDNFIDCVRTRKAPFCDAEVGHRGSVPGHLMNISWQTGRRVTWDPERERFPGQDDANALITRDYRKPWTLPTA